MTQFPDKGLRWRKKFIHAKLGFHHNVANESERAFINVKEIWWTWQKVPLIIVFNFSSHSISSAAREQKLKFWFIPWKQRPGISFGHWQTIKFLGLKAEVLRRSLFPFFESSWKSFKQTTFIKNMPLGSFNRSNFRTELYYLSQRRFCAKTFVPARFFLNKLAAAQTACQLLLCKDCRRRLDVTLSKCELSSV